MKNIYFEYNSLSEDELKELWGKATFVFDANVLLNLYRYSDDTREKFLEIMMGLGKRVWLPYQVGLEFHKNRLTVISEQLQLHHSFLKGIDDIISEIENKNRNPFLSATLYEKLVSVKDELKSEVSERIKIFDQRLHNDQILEKINSIFAGRVGKIYEKDGLEKLFSEGEKRYKELIPPGYRDKSKQGNDKFGDLVIWKQMINQASESKNSLLFITDDRKDDWWLEHKGKTISPHPVLLREFFDETQQKCHFYNPFQFLKYSNEYLGENINEDVIEEVKNYHSRASLIESFLKINLTLQGRIEDLTLFIDEMKGLGYNIVCDFSSHDDNHHDVCFLLPNIPDLERRLTDKYLSNLASYNINLVSIKKT